MARLRLRVVHIISIGVIITIFVVSAMLVMLANYGIDTALLFSFLNILGATFPPTAGLLDARSPYVLAAVALGGIANVAFTITFTTLFYQLLVGVDLRYFLAKQRVRSLKNHVVITPVNGIGLELARKLKAENLPFVFIDENISNVRRVLRRGMLALHGNAAEPDTLKAAKIDDAVTLFALFDDDIKNTLVTIEARRGTNRIRVISRIKRLDDIPKMEKAGARRTILPEAAVGVEISEFLVANA